MPAEWEKHDAIWLAWPYDPTTFPDRVERVEATYVQIVKEIHEGEEVNLFVIDEATKQKATKMFKEVNIDLGSESTFTFPITPTFGFAITDPSLSKTKTTSWR